MTGLFIIANNVFKYVFNYNKYIEIHRGDMNKCALFLVFICGAVFASLVFVLKNSLNIDAFISSQFRDVGIGILPPQSDLNLMDDGYISMVKIGPHDEKTTQHGHILKNKRATGTDLEERNSEIEALNCLKVAGELVEAGKTARAWRLLEHAHSLAPRHHDVLVVYGEYLEKHREDIVQADQLFLKALTVSPTSTRALKNRRRTQPVVEKIDSDTLNRINNKRDELALIPSLSSSLRRIKKEAYFHHIYHSAAIEGNTLTLPQIRMILETGLSVGGKSITEHNEILGLDSALKYINTTLVHRIGRITLSDILEIHRRVLGHVDPVGSGLLRTTQVFVSDHVPPPPLKLELLMEGFISWLNSVEAQNLHPIKYAALAHYKLVFIHPFVDGNGRTARLLMNFLLMQAGYPPVIIRKQDRSLYYNYLQMANDGDTRPFVRFIAHCTEKTIDVYLWATKEKLPEIEQEKSENEVENRRLRMENLYTVNKIDENNNMHMLPDEDDSGFYNTNTYYDHSKIDNNLWLHGHEDENEKSADVNSKFSRVLDESDIYDTLNDIKRLKTYPSLKNVIESDDDENDFNQKDSFEEQNLESRNVW